METTLGTKTEAVSERGRETSQEPFSLGFAVMYTKIHMREPPPSLCTCQGKKWRKFQDLYLRVGCECECAKDVGEFGCGCESDCIQNPVFRRGKKK